MNCFARFGSVAFLTAVCGFAACASDSEVGEDSADATDCTGARLDSEGVCRSANGRFAKAACCAESTELSCDVVLVDIENEESILEESFGSLYDIDSDEGYLTVDEDSTSISITLGAESKVYLGGSAYSTADGDKIEKLDDDEAEYGPQRDSFRITPSHGGESFLVRIFEHGLGLIMYETEGQEYGPEHYATLDCRGVLDTPAPTLDASDLGCNVVWVDYDVSDFDEGLVFTYDMNYDGESQGDDSYNGLYANLEDSGWDVQIGGISFNAEREDTVSMTEDDGHELGLIQYDVTTEDDDVYQVRIFRETGLGVVLAGTTDTGATTELARLDCRGIESPDLDY